MLFNLLAPKHFLLFKLASTKQDLKSSLMTQGHHSGKQLHNDVISWGLLRQREPLAAEDRVFGAFRIPPASLAIPPADVSLSATSGNLHAGLTCSVCLGEIFAYLPNDSTGLLCSCLL